jgi:hypothetical protein
MAGKPYAAQVRAQAVTAAVGGWLLRPRVQGAFLVALALVLIWQTYGYVGSAGYVRYPWPGYMQYYDLLAEGFRKGQLHIPVEPAPQLLAQRDPYSPLHRDLWLWDISLYKGKYYLYWGPVPAAFLAGAKAALDIDKLIGDQYLVCAMFALSALFGALLIERVRHRLFPRVPKVLLIGAVLTFGFANPTLHLVASGGVYQAAIGASQAFLLCGLLFAFDAVWRSPARPPAWQLIAAGTGFGLALACRISVFAAIAVMGVATALSTGFRRGGFRPVLRDGTWMAAPMVASGLGLLVYNQLRFENWFEFGTKLQLSTMKFRYSSEYFIANLYSYIFSPFNASCEFPQLRQEWNRGLGVLPKWISVPSDYLVTEPVVGWGWAAPVAWFGLVALVVAARKVHALSTGSTSNEEQAHGYRSYIFCVLCFVVLSTTTGFADMGLFLATMRYLADVTNGLVLLGLLGAFSAYSAARSTALRRVVSVGVLVVMGGTIAAGLMLGYQGYLDHFKRYNPSLHAEYVKSLSTCGKPKQRSTGP